MKQALCVHRDSMFKNGNWQGLKTDNLDAYLALIKENYIFLPREEIEEDPQWQQIIPYIVFKHKEKFFMYHYLEAASEKRLLNQWMLGIGGHIEPFDEGVDDVIEAGLMREWDEEVNFSGNLVQKKLVGLLNDETRPVEAVHLGLVYLFEGDTPDIKVKETHILEGKLFSKEEMKKELKESVGWAPMIYSEF